MLARMRLVYLVLIHLLAPAMLAGRWLRGLRRPDTASAWRNASAG